MNIMDPNQIIDMGADAYNALDTDSKHALTYPAAKTLGLAADGLISIFCYPLLKARIFTQEHLKQYQKELANKINEIPEENRDSSKLGLVVKAIEESRYQLNEDDIREMYVNLIAATVDNRKNKNIGPRFTTIIAQLSPSDAKFLSLFNHTKKTPDGYLDSLPIFNIKFCSNDNKHVWYYKRNLMFDEKGSIEAYEDSIDIIKSFGIVDIIYGSHDEGYENEFSKVEKHVNSNSEYYQRLMKEKNENEDTNYTHIKIEKGSIKLTSLGRRLMDIIFP